jgi:hypothetical protein
MLDTEKIKLKVINLPINKKWELILDFKNIESLTLSLYQIFRTLSVKDRIKSQWPINTDDVYKVKDTQIITEQQPAISNISAGGDDDDAWARSKINEILAMLREHWLIETL